MENNQQKQEAGLNETYRNFFSAVFKELASAIMGIIIATSISTISVLIPILNPMSQGLYRFTAIVSLISSIYIIIQVFNIHKILKESSETLDNE
jgi:hypothetical protein